MPTLPPIVIFDDGLGLLSPLTDLRASFEVHTGAFTTLERVRAIPAASIAAWASPESLQSLIKERVGFPPLNDLRGDGSYLFINGRCPIVPPAALGLEPGNVLVEERSSHIIAAHIGLKHASAVIRSEASGLTATKHATHALIARPWDIRAFRDTCIAHDLALLAASRKFRSPHPGLHIAPTAKFHESAIFDAEHGPIVIDEHVTIRPGSIIVGPAYIGPHSTVLERTLIKANTAIGPWCKVAGEIGGTIFQGFANKAHDGHLGDSWVGEWANLGAGTTNSNLLNTYGEVIARPLGTPTLGDGSGESPKLAALSNERTGQQFLGATIGDHVKTAICTRIMTGAIIGTGTMYAASGPLSGTVPPLSWITDSGTKPFAMDKFIEVAKAAMARRKIVPSGEYLEGIRQLATSR
jgi:UDP-N-acetylglucosamine diphosphorylase/glucosamine-1-phosphate N-acetyltransferase